MATRAKPFYIPFPEVHSWCYSSLEIIWQQNWEGHPYLLGTTRILTPWIAYMENIPISEMICAYNFISLETIVIDLVKFQFLGLGFLTTHCTPYLFISTIVIIYASSMHITCCRFWDVKLKTTTKHLFKHSWKAANTTKSSFLRLVSQDENAHNFQFYYLWGGKTRTFRMNNATFTLLSFEKKLAYWFSLIIYFSFMKALKPQCHIFKSHCYFQLGVSVVIKEVNQCWSNFRNLWSHTIRVTK